MNLTRREFLDVLAAASAVSTPIFAAAGRLARSIGHARLMIGSLAGRMLALFTLSLLSYQDFPGRESIALARGKRQADITNKDHVLLSIWHRTVYVPMANT